MRLCISIIIALMLSFLAYSSLSAAPANYKDYGFEVQRLVVPASEPAGQDASFAADWVVPVAAVYIRYSKGGHYKYSKHGYYNRYYNKHPYYRYHKNYYHHNRYDPKYGIYYNRGYYYGHKHKYKRGGFGIIIRIP